MSNTLYPLLFEPVYQDYIWGGTRIPKMLEREAPATRIAESWEVSDRDEGPSRVANGALKGQSLADLLATHGAEILGRPGTRFPLLIKLIDAQARLSVQVHPNDETAAKCAGEAKTEMWYILAAEPDAAVYAGLKQGTTVEDLRTALQENAVEHYLNRIPVKAGEVIFMPGGRVHAIGEGCLLLEVQQNSNTTYRLYDWGRTGSDGKPRPLHIQQALEVITWDDAATALVPHEAINTPDMTDKEYLTRCDYFTVEKWGLAGPTELSLASGFRVVFAEQGDVEIHTCNADVVHLPHGRTALLPAALGTVTLTPTDTTSVVIVIGESNG